VGPRIDPLWESTVGFPAFATAPIAPKSSHTGPLPDAEHKAAAHSESEPFWLQGGTRAVCPVCHSGDLKDVLSGSVLYDIRMQLSGASQTILEYMKCRECETVFAPVSQAPHYEEAYSAESIRYYLEEGAGIDLLMEPLFKIDTTRVQRYAEVGCSFGFSLDAARHCFGWEVLGVDPSPLAALGRDVLHLPIDIRYLNAGQPIAGLPVDLLQASEVIEHVTDPHAFMHALLASLAEDGVLIISTPNGSSLRATASDDQLMQTLQPHVHLVLFSEGSLIRLMKAHGLNFYQSQVTSADVTIFASRHPFVFYPETQVERAPYLEYLKYRLDRSEPGSALRRGMYSRLLKEYAFQERFGEAEGLIGALSAEYRVSCGIDLHDVDAVTCPNSDTCMQPFNMQGILYCLGTLEIIHRKDRHRGIRYLEAAANWSHQAGSPRALFGFEDASSEHITRNARWLLVSAKIALDPAAEYARMINAGNQDGVAPAVFSLHRQMLFIELTNLGDYARAEHLYDVVAAEMGTTDLSYVQASDESIGHRAMVLYTLGILTLNHRGNRAMARAWFNRAATIAKGDPALGHLRRAIESASFV
jgi:SAM-dependent methyltransferase